MYNTSLVRQLCTDIISEQDRGKVDELVALLRAVISDDQEEIRTRMTFLAKKYALVSQSAAD